MTRRLFFNYLPFLFLIASFFTSCNRSHEKKSGSKNFRIFLCLHLKLYFFAVVVFFAAVVFLAGAFLAGAFSDCSLTKDCKCFT